MGNMDKKGTYLVFGVMRCDLPGTAELHFSMLVFSASGRVTGHATVSRPSVAGNPQMTINNLTGEIFSAAQGGYTRLVTLRGTSYFDGRPHAVAIEEVSFNAVLALDDDWNGIGGFSCGPAYAENATVEHTPV